MFRVSTNSRYREVNPGVFVPAAAVDSLSLSAPLLPQHSRFRLWFDGPIPTYIWRTALWLALMILLGILLGMFWVNINGLKIAETPSITPYTPPLAEPAATANTPQTGKASCEDSIARVLAQPILFDSGSDRLTPSSRDLLESLVNPLRVVCPDTAIAIYGHTDAIGNPADNIRLSEQRAKAVADLLVTKGVSRERMTVEGFGAGRPIADNATAEGRARNRRIEIKLNLSAGGADATSTP